MMIDEQVLQKAVQRIYHAPGLESFVDLPLVVTDGAPGS